MLARNLILDAYRSQLANKLSMCLSLLGIIIGVVALNSVFSFKYLLQQQINIELEQLGANKFALFIFTPSYVKQQVGINYSQLTALEHYLEQKFQTKIVIEPYVELFPPIYLDGRHVNARVIAVTSNFFSLLGMHIATGHNFNSLDFKRVAILGDKLSNKDLLLDSKLFIAGRGVDLLGTLSPVKDNYLFAFSPNESIYVPLEMYLEKKTVLFRDFWVDVDLALQKKVQISIAEYIQEHNAMTCSFVDASVYIDSLARQAQNFKQLLLVIAVISLVLGNFYIINNMLHNITMRKGEIGIRLASGANSFEIGVLFLLESIVLLVIGWVIGSILAIFVLWLLSYVLAWKFSLFIVPFILSFFILLSLGLLSGLYPAFLAAKLHPRELLQQI